jgi:hypothetical protein
MSPASRREGEGVRCPASVERRRRHRGEAEECKKGDAIPDLLLKHLYATVTTYV